ncbi:hypothetical protein tinsulaeT_02120 [Thalassotalea insulae]|uniref:Chemotaxis protein n=1 Tax=Thalassotalea insulae TaxID=2056778 RepID=A0ABQ6GLR6_9GAMM|nr:hypothetical protein [Thalassotalea insulae]GLX76872.1 hypothetical protein tinsulaeT_02120 [Thalassotalea insulae]
MSAYPGSTSYRPDLDWSQLKETILMLNLAVAQIDQSLNDGNASISTLSSSFTALATNLNDIKSSTDNLHNDETQNEKIKAIIDNSADAGLDKVQSAIIAFQFYDKLSQRLDHVSNSLSALSVLIADPESLYSPQEWQNLQESIRSKYSMEEERQMFDNVISGMPISEALAVFRQEKLAHQIDDDDIELF